MMDPRIEFKFRQLEAEILRLQTRLNILEGTTTIPVQPDSNDYCRDGLGHVIAPRSDGMHCLKCGAISHTG